MYFFISLIGGDCMTQGVFLDFLFCSLCTIGILVLFMGCGIVIFVRRKRKYDCINILSGILMIICFLILLFLLWCVIGFGSNVPNSEPKPSGYHQVWNGIGNRTTIFKKNGPISSSHIY